MEQPKFIRDFTKEKSSDERNEAAAAIKAKRTEYFTEQADKQAEKAELETALTGENLLLSQQLAELESLSAKINEIQSNLLNKLLGFFEYKRLKSEIEIGKKTYEELRSRVSGYEHAISSMEETSEGDFPAELQEAKQILAKFYEDQKLLWEQSEFDPGEVEKYFTEEHLSSLTLDEYILLQKRFPSEMVAHVTRQGVRDHTGHADHTDGYGEYADGFMEMARDGRLRSPLGVYLANAEEDRAIANFLHLDLYETEEQARESLDELLTSRQGESGSYSDRSAIHFAAEEVADTYYGSEKGNEIFLAYPSLLIAAQHHYSGELTRMTNDYWNDQWIWANEEKGLDIDAGLVFLPEATPVDIKTGSRYELDSENKPVKDRVPLEQVQRFTELPDFQSLATEIMEITRTLYGSEEEFDDERLDSYRMLLRGMGITDKRVQNTIFEYQNLYSLTIAVQAKNDGRKEALYGQDIDSTIWDLLEKRGLQYRVTSNPISSKEYWEKYFTDNPDSRPSKVVYYQGDPTTALHNWRKENGLTKEVDASGFDIKASKIRGDDPRATAGLDRFKSIAEKVISDHFGRESIAV